jgi:hypothetical protein
MSEGPRTAGTGSPSEAMKKADMQMEARSAYIQALVAMGAEKHAEAMTAIDKAISLDPKTREYKDIRELIKKNIDKKK